MDKKAFSLIEVVVATWILSIAVFWVYKMIWENNKIINNSNNFLNKTALFPVLETCIEDSWVITWTFYIDLWNDLKSCIPETNEIINKIDNVEYILKAEMINDSLSKSRIWETSIFSNFSWTSSWIYIQKK